MRKFHKIKAFHHIVKTVAVINEDPDCLEQYKLRAPVTYAGTVKLHGTNAGVECTADALVPQSRSRVITIQDDNLGFAAFVAGPSQQESLRDVERWIRDAHAVPPEEPLTIFGEWCGPGIQKGCGIHRLPSKQFVIFAVKVGDGALPPGALTHEPYPDAGIHFIESGPGWSIAVDFTDMASVGSAAKTLTSFTEEVENQCPWAEAFGVEGIGEGIVWRPVGEHADRSDLWFKTKGDKHKKVGPRKRGVQASPEVVASIADFVTLAVTDERLSRGIHAMCEDGHPIEMTSTGHFLRWIAGDVCEECETELVASDLVWKQVAKSVNAAALVFWKEAVESV